jgi:hypothetical protein
MTRIGYPGGGGGGIGNWNVDPTLLFSGI